MAPRLPLLCLYGAAAATRRLPPSPLPPPLSAGSRSASCLASRLASHAASAAASALNPALTPAFAIPPQPRPRPRPPPSPRGLRRRYGSRRTPRTSFQGAAGPFPPQAAATARPANPPSDSADADADADAFAGRRAAEALAGATGLLRRGRVSEPEWGAVHLLSAALGLDWDLGYRRLREVAAAGEGGGGEGGAGGGGAHSSASSLAGRALTAEEGERLAAMLRRRLRHEPLQYILGRWDFCDLTLRVRSPCLCPRPETEELVDLAALDVARALALAQTPGRKRVRVLDVGCGSGAVGLALASRFGTAIDVTAIDVEPMAVELANENALEVLGGEASYRAVLCGADGFGGPKFDVVVSNPPYIPRADMAGLAADVVGYEADEALCGGEDGLDVVRAIVRRLPDWAAGGGCTCWMEVDTSHPALIERWLGGGATGDGAEGGATGVHFCEGVRDLCGRDRFVKLRVPPRGSQERNGNHEINAY